jgi:HlyD family secretion protein
MAPPEVPEARPERAVRWRPGGRVLAGGAVVLIALAAVAWRLLDGPTVATYGVERRDIVQTVVASGRVESPRRVDIGSPLVGTVAAIPVEEGQSVRAGQLLVALDDLEAKAALEQARTAVAQAQAKLRQLRETALPVAAEAVRQAEVNLGNAERSLARTRELFAKGFVGQAALDDSQRARDVALSQLRSAEVQQRSSAGGGTDERMAIVGLEQARAAERAARAHLEQLTIEAPVDGVLISRSVEKGNVVQPGRVLMVLSPAGETQLVVQFDEKNLSLLRVGQKALASADAFPQTRFPAVLVYINPGVDATRGSVEVKLRVPEPPKFLLQDMTVSVDVEVASRPGVLTLPADAVRDPATAAPWVLAVREGRAVRQAVKTGAVGRGLVEIAEGLAPGELAVPSTNVKIHEGDRVRAAPAAAPAASLKP